MWSHTSFIAFGCLAAFTTAIPPNAKLTRDDSMVYNFTDITPSTEIRWRPCYDDFECAYLTVPLDYDCPEGNSTDIAFIKYQSVNSSAQDVLFNPGTRIPY